MTESPTPEQAAHIRSLMAAPMDQKQQLSPLPILEIAAAALDEVDRLQGSTTKTTRIIATLSDALRIMGINPASVIADGKWNEVPG